jgi:GT2 family glycosyltransferase
LEPQGFELVVVDDGSTDDSPAKAEAAGACVIRHSRPLGPAAARNAGAKAASGSLVFFLDADVVPHRDMLTRALAHLRRRPELAALFGSYDDRPSARGLVSEYRNLLHHFVHQSGDFDAEARPAHTFWTGCGLVRRRVFLDLGGFDPELYRRPAIEDIEFGYRLSRAGHRIALARDVQVTHQKRWTLRSILMTDVFHRGVPWMLLMLRTGTIETDLNVSRRQRASVAATALGLLGLAASAMRPEALMLVVLNLLVLLVCNGDFYRFLARRKGWVFAGGAVPLHWVYYCCCGASVLIAAGLRIVLGRGEVRMRTDSTVPPRPAGLRVRGRRRHASSSSSTPADERPGMPT